MSKEAAFETTEQLADYNKDDVELYYHFWVIPNTSLWYQSVDENSQKTSNKVSQKKISSPLSIVLLVSCLVLGVIGLSSWGGCPMKSQDYQESTINY